MKPIHWRRHRRQSPRPRPAPPNADANGTAGADDVKVIVTGASQQAFPRIAVQFEVKRADGTFLLDAGRDDFRVTEEGRDVEVVEFQAPQNKEAIATTVVLVVDRSGSMEEEDRIGGLKRAVRSFLEKLPEGSKSLGDRVWLRCRSAHGFHDGPRASAASRRCAQARGSDTIL